MSNLTNALIVCGGRSPEHNISLISATSVLQHIDTYKYNVAVVVIDRKGQWFYHGDTLDLRDAGNPNQVTATNQDKPKVILDHNHLAHTIRDPQNGTAYFRVDVIFPVLHGRNGEDGSIQGLFRIAGVPFVGCDVLGSSICMDKDVTKRLLRDHGVPIADFITLRKGSPHPTYLEITNRLGKELFIKPANLGSSVGVAYVTDESAFHKAIQQGFLYDNKVIVEEKIVGREIECAVLGNAHPEASPIGEIVPKSGIYSYENKYVDDDGAMLSIPADIPVAISEKARQLAVEIYTVLECSGMARVDMFLKSDGALILNEVNTIPGFTSISMYPKLWIAAGKTYSELIHNLLTLALEVHEST